jgi:hypothetical protein
VLEREGHQVYTDEELIVGLSYRDGVHQHIARSDYVVALLSAASAKDKSVTGQIVDAYLQSSRTGKA